jgi:hypothetical protein
MGITDIRADTSERLYTLGLDMDMDRRPDMDPLDMDRLDMQRQQRPVMDRLDMDHRLVQRRDMDRRDMDHRRDMDRRPDMNRLDMQRRDMDRRDMDHRPVMDRRDMRRLDMLDGRHTRCQELMNRLPHRDIFQQRTAEACTCQRTADSANIRSSNELPSPPMTFIMRVARIRVEDCLQTMHAFMPLLVTKYACP